MEDYRTCTYEDKKYIFHCFEQWSNVIGESPNELADYIERHKNDEIIRDFEVKGEQ